MMRKIYLISILIMMGCFFYVSALANMDFEFYPPDEVPDWLTEPPYQRNIYLDFLTNPTGDPGPIPGAVYEGLADEDVWDSDQVETHEDVIVESGRIGIGEEGGSGSIVMHLANLENLNPVKRIYIEGIVDISNPFGLLLGWVDADYKLPDGYEEVDYDYDFEPLPDGTYLLYGWVKINPNPPWEEAKLIFKNIPKGEYAWIESVHIATECVPRSKCLGDSDSDGDVDGDDLAGYPSSGQYLSLEEFAKQFGKTDCSL